MRTGDRWIVAGGLAAAAAVLLWIVLGPSVRSSAAGARDAGGRDVAVATGDLPRADSVSREESSASEAEAAPAAGRRTETGGTLVLRVHDRGGRPVAGVVRWRTGARAPRTADMLVQGAEPSRAVDASGFGEHAGEARLHVPEGHWTWLRASAGPGALGAGTFLLVPPFAGTVQREVRIDAEQRALHVFVLEPDLRSPAPGRSVRLFAVDGPGGTAAPVREDATDDHGHLTWRGLAPGGYLVCAPGAEPGDRAPHVQRVMLPAGMPRTELPCTLVAMPAAADVVLRLSTVVSGERMGALQLVLQREDDGSGRVFPAVQSVRAGIAEVPLRLPHGVYRVVPMPAGAAEVAGGHKLLSVDGTATLFPITLMARPAATELTLQGLEPRDFPVTVYARLVDEVIAEPEEQYCGPYRWFQARHGIAAPRGSRRIVVRGRHGCWIARDDVVLVKGPVEVPLEPASEVRVRWVVRDVASVRGAMLEASSAAGTVLRSLPVRLMNVDGADVAGLEATVVVPRGTVTLRGLAPEVSDGWERQIEAGHASESVLVIGSRGEAGGP